jgi:hypothetical protein
MNSLRTVHMNASDPTKIVGPALAQHFVGTMAAQPLSWANVGPISFLDRCRPSFFLARIPLK